MLVRFCLYSLICSVLYGCATSPSTSWQHTSITDRQTAAKLFLQDIDYCVAVAGGAAPMPPIQPAQQPVTTNINGKIKSYDTTTGQTTYHTYNGVATSNPSGGFAGGVANGVASGLSLGAYIAASERQERLEKMCMTNRGWVEVPAGGSFAAPLRTSTVETAQLSKSIQTTPETTIYESKAIEREADLKEFFSFFPSYENSKSLNEQFNERIRVIETTQPKLNGPKIFILAHQSLSSNNQVKAAHPDSLELKTYLKAVDGSSVDQAGMGVLYMQGSESGGIYKNLNRSAYWNQKSGNAGNPIGQTGFGLLLFYGQGIKANRIEGYKLVKQASSVDSTYVEIVRKLESEMTQDELKLAQQEK